MLVHLQKKKGFTLIELLVVISIIGLLSSVVLAALGSARSKGAVAAGQTFDSHTYQAFGANAYAMWSFDDSTNLGVDTSGNNRNLAITSATYSAAGIKGGALAFTSGSSVVTSQFSNGIPDVSKGSISFWTKFSGAQSGTVYFLQNTPSVNIRYTPSGILYGQLSLSPSVLVSSSVSIKSDTWYHILLSWDASATSKLNLYVNGKLIASSQSVPNPTTLNTAYSSWGPGLTGLMDEIRYYSQSLQTAEVEKIYAEGLEKRSLATNLK